MTFSQLDQCYKYTLCAILFAKTTTKCIWDILNTWQRTKQMSKNDKKKNDEEDRIKTKIKSLFARHYFYNDKRILSW